MGGGGEEEEGGFDKYMSYLETLKHIHTILLQSIFSIFLYPILSFITHLSNKVY